MPPPLPLSYVGVLSLTRCLSDCLVACCLSLTHFVLSPSTSLWLSLSLIVRLTHTISLSDSLSHAPSLFHTRSLPLSLTRFLSHTLITASFPLSLSFSKLLTRCYSLSFTRWLPASLPLAFTSLSHSPTRCFSLISYLSPTRCLSHTVSSSLSYLSAISQPALSLALLLTTRVVAPERGFQAVRTADAAIATSRNERTAVLVAPTQRCCAPTC